MANGKQILAKIARDAGMIGLTVNSLSQSACVIENGSNDLTISYVAASIQSPMGGVSDASSPFLGIGVANPGKIKIKSSSTANDNISDVIDSMVAAKVLALCAGFANNILLENSDATFSGEIAGHPDMLGMGQ